MVSSNYYFQDNADIETKKFEAAKSHYKKGDYNAALKLYLGMQNTSSSAKLYFEIGRCFYKLDEIYKAEEYFNKSVALERVKNSSYLYLGNIFYKREDIKNAIENWACAYAYKPDDEAVCLNLATSYFSKGMKFQSVFYYEKYLKYAKEHGNSYSIIKNSLDKCTKIAKEFTQRANIAISKADNKTAIEYLNYAVVNSPTSFDINYALGRAYMDEKDYMHALIFLKQAYCIDNHSLDVIQKMASVYINLGDYTAAYCTMRRLLPLVIHNQQEYLTTMKTIKELDSTFDEESYLGHKEWAEKYLNENNYHLALFEYENCLIMKSSLSDDLEEKIERLKSFIMPEERIIKSCMDKGNDLYKEGDYKISNKYFTKIMLLAVENSPEYKLAKSKIV